LLTHSEKDLKRFIKNILGFKPRNVHLYQLALLHRSAAQGGVKGVKNTNERLEYLGDAVLSSVIADFLFHKYPLKDEGFLTEMRSKIVNRAHLNQLSKKMGLDKMIQSEQENGSVYKSINGDAFEAVIGAVYLDKGYKFVRKVIINRIISCYIDIEVLEKKESNYKSTLIEFAQKEKKQVEFKVIEKTGQGYHKQYVVGVYFDNNQIAKGYGYSIKEAEQNGAAHAYNELFGNL
jgi:ribonuclease III